MSQDNADVYNRLSNEPKAPLPNQKWNFFLIACCITATLSSFIFGFNIGVINLPTPLVKEFYSKRYFGDYHSNAALLEKANSAINLNLANIEKNINNTLVQKTVPNTTNLTVDQFVAYLNATKNNLTNTLKGLELKKTRLDEAKVKVEGGKTLLWILTTSIFVIGGTIGALTSKYVAEYFGRKKGILFHYLFVFVGAILSFISPYVNSPECVIIGRFLYGVQGGMACGLIPTYLAEISPSRLRGATGVIHQLALVLGILLSQILGFRQLLGVSHLWHFLLGLPIVPALIGSVLLFLFFPESPGRLLNTRHDEAAQKSLAKLRQTKDVSEELEEIRRTINQDVKSSNSITIVELFTSSEYRWPLITGLILQITQQLCGINAIFFYSESIFLSASIEPLQIQYAVVLTGVVNVVSTIIVVPLIDKLGRRPLLIFPMALMVIDFIVLTFFLVFKGGIVISYLSIVCIIIFILCFAVGLGPIPFIYVAECFKQEARSTALAVCMGTNWLANLILTLTFPYIALLLGPYTFLVFAVIVSIALVLIYKKVPETKGRSIEEITAEFDPKTARQNQDANKKLMSNTNV